MNRRQRQRWMVALGLGLVLAVLSLSLVPTAAAQTKTLRWHRWDADIQINTDGTFDVQEVYEIEFIGGDFTFGYRNITIDQFENIRDIQVREGGVAYTENQSESPNTFYWTKNSSEYVINWFYPATRDQTRTFTVEYTVEGGLIIGDNDPETGGDRFFWKAVGGDHAFPIESSTVMVHLPQGATVNTGGSRAPASFGPSSRSQSIAGDQRSVTYIAQNIPANQWFEVGVNFTHGVVPDVKPSWQNAYEREQRQQEVANVVNLFIGAGSVLLLIVGLFGVYLLYMLKGRDPDVGAVPEYLSEPPSDLPPGLVGTLVDEKADMQDIVATLVDLARKGAIDMKETEKSIFGLATSHEFTYHRRDDFEGELRPYEATLIRKMFGAKDKVDLEDLKNKFYTAIPQLQKELYKEAVKEELFPTGPEKVRGRYLGLGIAVIVLAAGAGFCSAAALVDMYAAILCPFIAVGVAGLALAVTSRAMPAKSRHGAEEASKWRAFKEYLKNAERYNELKEATDQFDKYLPFAIAFGLERTWVNKFSRVPNTPMPAWYFPARVPYNPSQRYGRMVPGRAGGSADGVPDLRGDQVRPGPSLDGLSDQMFGGLSSMTDGLFSMLNTTSSVFGSVPQSSGSGGGFSGGGFSGGGFSGGGGGGGGGAGFG